MTDPQQVRLLYALLQELPRERREELVVEEWGVAAGREPENDTERANWYGSALRRLARPVWQNTLRGRDDCPSLDDALQQVREEVEAQESRPEDVGVLAE